jgi:formylglycine-generating enzyme required for sulfatase activity
MDLDGDGDADQSDFGIVQVCYSGEDNPLDPTTKPNCAPPPGMVHIPAGEFQMGDSFGEGVADERPVHTVYVNAFFMDRTEVTNQQYADALNWANTQGELITISGGAVYNYDGEEEYCSTTTSSSDSGIIWNGSNFGATAGKEYYPMVEVSWHGSVAYANWRSAMQGKPLCYDLSTWDCNFANGYRLPTEAEWEKAARGGTSGHRFPWSDSDDIQHARVNYYSNWSSGVPSYRFDTSPTEGHHPTFNTGVYPYSSPVRYFAANGYGLYDMSGNVWEWCNDWYSPSYYGSSPYNNPHGPTTGNDRVIRGGSWRHTANAARCAYRQFSSFQLYPISYFRGFRLVLNSP